jgi:hypothetical protein
MPILGVFHPSKITHRIPQTISETAHGSLDLKQKIQIQIQIFENFPANPGDF